MYGAISSSNPATSSRDAAGQHVEESVGDEALLAHVALMIVQNDAHRGAVLDVFAPNREGGHGLPQQVPSIPAPGASQCAGLKGLREFPTKRGS
jgi:hypothetical protein